MYACCVMNYCDIWNTFTSYKVALTKYFFRNSFWFNYVYLFLLHIYYYSQKLLQISAATWSTDPCMYIDSEDVLSRKRQFNNPRVGRLYTFLLLYGSQVVLTFFETFISENDGECMGWALLTEFVEASPVAIYLRSMSLQQRLWNSKCCASCEHYMWAAW